MSLLTGYHPATEGPTGSTQALIPDRQDRRVVPLFLLGATRTDYGRLLKPAASAACRTMAAIFEAYFDLKLTPEVYFPKLIKQ